MNLTQNICDKTFDSLIRVLPISDLAEDGIIAIKNILTNNVLKEKIKDTFSNIFNGNTTIFEKIEDMKSVINEGEIKSGISKTIDDVINNAKKNKTITGDVANLLKNSKELIMDKLLSEEIDNRYKGQERVLNNIDKEYLKFEKYLENRNLKKMNRSYEKIKEKYKELLPTVKIIEKINEIDNLVELSKNKFEKGENVITDLEKDICRKVG